MEREKALTAINRSPRLRDKPAISGLLFVCRSEFIDDRGHFYKLFNKISTTVDINKSTLVELTYRSNKPLQWVPSDRAGTSGL